MNKQEYFAKRNEWKTKYKEHSEQIRELKHAYKDAQREFSKSCGHKHWSTYSKDDWAIYNKVSEMSSKLLSMKAECKELFEELKQLKLETQRSYVAEKNSPRIRQLLAYS